MTGSYEFTDDDTDDFVIEFDDSTVEWQPDFSITSGSGSDAIVNYIEMNTGGLTGNSIILIEDLNGNKCELSVERDGDLHWMCLDKEGTIKVD